MYARWLDKGEDDGQIVRDLAPVSDGSASGVKVAKYKISVRTGDKRGAGTGNFGDVAQNFHF